MNTGRVNPFADPENVPAFEVKPRSTKAVPAGQIDQLARDNNFPSRQPAKVAETKTAPPRRRRIHRTGRNQQLNIKATPETIERFYSLADQKNISLCELLEQALRALDTKAAS